MSRGRNQLVGWRFEPTDMQVIRNFLLPKAMGLPLPNQEIGIEIGEGTQQWWEAWKEAGWRFAPSDNEIILNFLLPKSMGFPLPRREIGEKTVYGKDAAAPWEALDEAEGLWMTDAIYANKKSTFIFTKLTKLSPDSHRYSRKAGCGSWVAESCVEEILHKENRSVIGNVKTLKFKSGEWWSSLSPVFFSRNNDDVVFCKTIKRPAEVVKEEAAAGGPRNKHKSTME